jgi:hypothetical protein
VNPKISDMLGLFTLAVSLYDLFLSISSRSSF